MVAFNLVAGICGIIAFFVLGVQGFLFLRTELRTEKSLFLTRDATRSLNMAKKACESRHLTFRVLSGTAAGVEVCGRRVEGSDCSPARRT